MRLRTKIIAHPLITAILLLAFVGVAAAAVPVFNATESPAFCASCHEMQPYYDAWKVGAHKGISCVACHVDGGTLNHVKHKVTAAKELWAHFSSDPLFPQGTADVPNARCLSCHSDIMSKVGPKFSHKQHAGAGACVACHSDAGHQVSLADLAKADILKPGLVASGSAIAIAAVARTGAVAIHKPVSCTKCHDLTRVACSKCHQPPHVVRGECATCHQPGPQWAFSHPVSTDCATCHTAPAKHFGASCTTCHSPATPFKAAVYKHASNDCATCHAAPAGHKPGACVTCHKRAGASWAFTHPNNRSCATCHAAPGGHNRSVGCASCHRIGAPFSQGSFRHTSSSCGSCHKAPSGHTRSVSCATCHKKRGVSWAASHPSSRACSSCHKAPASHFGSSCASCHKPLVSWRSATFSHPRNTGEHTYRSFACVKCHPSGYSSHSCTCHGGKTPSGD